MDTASLSDLCSSCHSQEPKYRCPRCKARTCSLDCYKRHQQRASCSGQRDPTTFIKRSQLATSGGVDHDFNYLRGIERRIENASNDLSVRGIDQPPKKSKVATRAFVPGGLLDDYLRQHDITVQHAPMGMSRQKTNFTRATKSGKVVWTVEWVDEDLVKRTQDDCVASSTVANLYNAFEAQMRNVEKRRLHPERFSGKRRKVSSSTRMPQRLDKINTGDSVEAKAEDQMQETNVDQAHSGREPPVADNEPGPIEAKDTDTSSEQKATNHERSYRENGPGHPMAPSKSTSTPDKPQNESTQHPSRFFYLHKPNILQSDKKQTTVLVPLDSTQTLTAALTTRTVQEYPTIYILPHPPEHLPDTFALEEADQSPVTKGALVSDERSAAQEFDTTHREQQQQPLPASAILDMLRRDVSLHASGQGTNG